MSSSRYAVLQLALYQPAVFLFNPVKIVNIAAAFPIQGLKIAHQPILLSGLSPFSAIEFIYGSYNSGIRLAEAAGVL